MIVASVLVRAFAEWILERPTRAERRAMKRTAAQIYDRDDVYAGVGRGGYGP